MRVLQLGKYYYPYMGGIENHLYLLCEQLADKVDLDVVVCHTQPRTVVERVGQVQVTRCLQAAHVASTSLCPTMPWVLSGREYDLLHVHFPHPMGVMAYLGSKKPRHHQVIVTYHSDIVKQEKLLKLYAPFMEQVMAKAAAIVCTSPDYIESSPFLTRYREKCRVIPYGIDLSHFARSEAVEAKAREIRARYEGPVAIGVGRLIYYKGFEYAVEAMKSVDGNLLLVGDGPLRGELEAKAKRLGVAKKVHFLGEIHNQDLTPYYRASDVFVLPSIARSEAFGIVQLEAMGCEKPVINTALDSVVPYASRHGESGLTVPPKNAEALAAALRELFADPTKAKALGQGGRKRVERDFSQEVMADRMLSLYGEVLGVPQAQPMAQRKVS